MYMYVDIIPLACTHRVLIASSVYLYVIIFSWMLAMAIAVQEIEK